MPKQLGARVRVPGPQKVNPFGSPPGPHGLGEIIEVSAPKYKGSAPMLTVKLDSGESIRIGSMFVSAV